MDHFSALPKDANKQAICLAVQDIIRDLHQTGNRTYADIAKTAIDLLSRPTALPPSAIKVFLEKADGRVNSNNRALPILYDYIRSDYQNFPVSTRQKVVHYMPTLIPNGQEILSPASIENEMERSLGLTLKNWLKISDNAVNKLSAKMFEDFSGDYVLLRKSVVNSSVVVKSRLRIDRASGRNSVPRVRHFHQDRQGVERISTGVFLPMVSNVYAILEVEYGEGLEFIALRNPIQWNFQKMMGFMTSMNMDRNILSARIFIERDANAWDGILSRFSLDDMKDNKYIMDRISLLDEGTSLTIHDI